MKEQPNKATVKDGLPTAKKVLAKHYDVDNRVDEAAIVRVMQEYSDQQNAELMEKLASEIESREHWQRQARRYQKYHRELNAALERVKDLEGTLSAYKECFEQFVPESKWDEATAFLSSYGNGLAKDFQLKENQ